MTPLDAPRRRTPLSPRALLCAGLALASLAAAALGLSSCTHPAEHYLLDAAMGSAHRPEPTTALPAGTRSVPAPRPATQGPEAAGYTILSGDLHCHVMPPDQAPHVTRGVAETVELARSEGLDFVVFTPHVHARFFMSEEYRAYTAGELAQLKRDVAAVPGPKPIFITGFEYTDHAYGHVGGAFADLDEVLAAVPVAEAARRPERFFEEFVARGGVLVVNHPLVTPIDSIISMARADLSWRPFTAPGQAFPPEIAAVNRLAQGFEAYNLTATHLRDRYLLGDTERTLLATLGRIDREILAQKRRMSPVGGSDSHSSHLRATTFVLAKQRTERGVRDALVGGRICVRDPGACSLEVREVRTGSGPWLPVGSSIQGASTIEARARGEEIQILVNGEARASLEGGSAGPVELRVDPSECSVVRARVGEGFSAPIYVNCPFAG